MGKIVKAVKPFIYEKNSNFKLAVYQKWKECGGKVVSPRPLEKYYKRLSYHIDLPTVSQSLNEARLRFVEGASVRFDTFPDYLGYEVIPIIWDCWPRYVDNMVRWFYKHRVRTAFFTSSQTAERMRNLCPQVNIFHLPEAIEIEIYHAGKPLIERSIDYLEFGRCSRILDSSMFDERIKVLSSRNEKSGLATRGQLVDALANSKITLALTRLDNQPELAEGIDTLTQRYWECMLSRVVIIGRAPQELIDIVGYDPIVHLNLNHANEQILDIISHIEDYQPLVDKNRAIAKRLGSWNVRIAWLIEVLEQLGYEVK